MALTQEPSVKSSTYGKSKFLQNVMCRIIKRHLDNTKSQAGKDKTNRQNTKKRSPESNIRHSKKKSKYIHLKLPIKIQSSYQNNCNSFKVINHKYAGTHIFPNDQHRMHIIHSIRQSNLNNMMLKQHIHLMLAPYEHGIATTTARHDSEYPLPNPKIHRKFSACNVLTFEFFLQNNRMAYKQLNFEIDVQDQEMEDASTSAGSNATYLPRWQTT